MKHSRTFLVCARLTATVALTLVPTAVQSDQPPRAAEPPKAAPLKLDIRKGSIENPVKGVIAGQTAAQAPVADGPKRAIERAAKAVVQEKSGAATAFVNPKVLPGRVQWHPTFEAACAASQKSGKPVLLFQMMGKLDDQFC